MPHVVHEDVRGAQQMPKGVTALLLLKVQHHAALVAVQVKEEGGPSAPRGPRRCAAWIASRRLYLDHIRAHVAQQLRGDGAEYEIAGIQDAYAG